jgi:hypothetical protein
MNSPIDNHLAEIRIAMDLLCRADADDDAEELKAQALHLVEHFEQLDDALSAGASPPSDWRRGAQCGG